jgi:hypothetical protein
MTILFLFLAAIIWHLLKISTKRNLVHLIVDVIVRSMENVLFWSMGMMIGFWIIEKEEQLDLIPGWFDKETTQSIDIDNTIPNNRSEYDPWDNEEEEEEVEPQEEIIHKTAIPRAFTRIQTPMKNGYQIDAYNVLSIKKGTDAFDHQQRTHRPS